MSDYDRFTGVSHISYPSYTEYLYENFSLYLDWAFLNIGGFYNAQYQSVYGKDPTTLRRVTNSPQTDGKVWESYRKRWVWENHSYGGSIPISGVYVNGTFSTSSGAYPHSINYRDGQVIFNSPLPTGTTVRVNHSFKLVEIHQADKSPWFKEVLRGDWVGGYPDFAQASSGAFNTLAKNRVTLPAVVVQVVPRRSFKGLQLGGGQIVRQDILFWVMAEQPWQTNQFADYISFQNHKTFRMFDLKEIQLNKRYPYNYDGTLNPSGLNYKQLVDTYFWKKVRCENIEMQEIADSPLSITTVRMTLEGDFGDI